MNHLKAQLIASTQEDNITKENEKFKEFKEAITQTLNDIKSDSIPKDDIINIISVIRKKLPITIVRFQHLTMEI